MAAVARSGKTSSEVKKDRLEADRINMSEDTDWGQEKEKNRFGFIFKLVIIGDTGCGKTCLLARLCGDNWEEQGDSTFIASFKIKTVEVDGKRIKLEMWDISGHTKFEHLGSMFYPGTSAVILAYDMTRRNTLDNCVARERVFREMSQESDPVKFLVGCKADLEDKREVSK